MSEKLFGRVFDSVGSSSSDLLLKTKGQVKVQWGNKYIDLIKDGNVNYPKEIIQKLIDDSIAAKVKQESSEENDVTNLTTQISEIQNKLDSEIERAQTQEQTLSSNINELLNSNDTVKLKKLIDTEISDRVQDVNTIKGVNWESSTFKDIDNLSTGLVNESLTREQNDNAIIGSETDTVDHLTLHGLNVKIQTETTRATETETAIQNELNDTQVGVGLDENGHYIKSTNSNYIQAAKTIAESIDLLDDQLNTINTELSKSISDLNTQLTQNNSTLENKINTEVSNRESAIQNVQEQITAIKNDYLKSSDKTELNDKIDQEIKDRTTAITSLTQQVINNSLPSKTVILFYGTSIPSGWLRCDGNNDTPVLNTDIDNLIYIMKQ